MRPLNRFVVLAIAVLTAFCFSHAATISGTVKNPDGGPFKGAFVEAQNAKTKVTIDVLSDKEGKYRIESLAAGDYDVKIRAIGYKADPRTGRRSRCQSETLFRFCPSTRRGPLERSESLPR